MTRHIFTIGRILASRGNSAIYPPIGNGLSIQTSNRQLSNEVKTKNVPGDPVKFTVSQANVDYKATMHFYHDDTTKPRSHNLVLASSMIFGIFYLFFLRDDVANDGGFAKIKPVHEQIPELAIPLLKSSIEENKRYGRDTSKLEKKLAEYMQTPELYGRKKAKLVEN